MAIALVAINKKEEKYKVVFTISRLCDKRTNGYSLPEYSDVLYRRLVSSVGRAPVCRAECHGFKPRPDHHSVSLNN